MKDFKYIVADHLFKIHLDDAVDDTVIPRSFEKFLVNGIDGAAPDLFSLTVESGFHNLLEFERDEVASFNWDGYLCTIYRDRDSYSMDITKDGELFSLMATLPDFSEATVFLRGDNVQQDSYMLNNFIMMLYAFSSSLLNTLMVHASVIMNDNKAYLFLGKSGTGKSTHSQLWLDNVPGSELMNDDNPIVRLHPDGKVIAYGSPWSGKTPCYRNLSAPAAAFVMLEQAPENEIVRESYSNAFASLLISCSVFRHHDELYRTLCDTIIKIVEQVPSYKLKCRPDREAAELSSSTIRE